MKELKEIRLTVGRVSGVTGGADDTKEIKFKGRQIASYKSYHGDDRGTRYYIIYETEKGKYLLHASNWNRRQGEFSNKHYEVYDSLEEMKEEILDSLIYEAKEELGQDEASNKKKESVKMKKIINLTKHDVNIIEDGKELISFPKCEGEIPRVSIEDNLVSSINGIDIFNVEFGEVKNLPKPKAGHYFIVSRMVLEAVEKRNDLIFPHGLVRNDDGQIIGARGFAK